METAEITRPDRSFVATSGFAELLAELSRQERTAPARPLSGQNAPVPRTIVVPVGDKSIKFEYLDHGDSRPKWFWGVLTGFAKLAALPNNWDQEGAAPIDRQVINRALTALESLLPADAVAPSIVPLPSSGLQIEWHRGERDLEIEFNPGGDVGFYYYDGKAVDEREGRVGPKFSRVRELLPRVL